MPEVSVIVPGYNHGLYLQQRIDSILNQTFQDFELIILDDCSTDNSRDIINTYSTHPKVSHVVFNEKNSGSPFQQWRNGMALAQGKWLWIAESDDYAAPTFLETLLGLYEPQEQTGLIYAGSHWVNDKNEIGKDLSSYIDSFTREGVKEIIEKLWHVCTIQNVSSCIMLRSLATECIKGLEGYRACGDWMFYIKMLQHTDLKFTGTKLNYFRFYHNNTSNYAEKNKIWITEGVHVLKYLPYKDAHYTIRNTKPVFSFWYHRIKILNGRKKHDALTIFIMSMFKYFIGRLSFKKH